MKHDTSHQTGTDHMTDPTPSAKFAARALYSLAQHDAEPLTNRLARKVYLADAINDAVASGVARFQASVAAGSLPRALPHDAALNVLVALEDAGFRITKAPAKK